MTAEEVIADAHSAGRDAAWRVEWRWSLARRAWQRGDTAAIENRCPDCGDDLGENRRVKHADGCRCACERSAYKIAYDEFFEANKRFAIPEEWIKAGFPPRYAGCRFDNFKPRTGTETALGASSGWSEGFSPRTARGLFLCGPYGSGKSHLMAATSYRVVERTLTQVRFASAGGLLQQVKGGVSIDNGPVRLAVAAKLLALDDVGQVGRTEFDRELLYTVISERYDLMRPTLVTSNLPPAKLGELLGGALASRLYEACEILVLDADDYRKLARGRV